jgi:hypothetical protein
MVKKSSTWQKSSSKFMMSSLAWLSGDFRLLEDTAYPELTLSWGVIGQKGGTHLEESASLTWWAV